MTDTRIYDIFRMEDGSLVKVAWKDDSNRDTPIQKNDDGLFVNAAPLPEGQPAGSAKLAGSAKHRGPISINFGNLKSTP